MYAFDPESGEAGVFVGTESGYVLGYDRETGEKLWENRVAGVVEHPPVVADGVVRVASERGDLSAFDVGAGGLLYEEEIAPGFEFTVLDGIPNDDERDTTPPARSGGAEHGRRRAPHRRGASASHAPLATGRADFYAATGYQAV